MKLKFFIVSVALCLFNLNATDAVASSSAADVPPALAFNPEELAKPTGMSSMQWIDALERDRNTADCIGNFAAFKALTMEISATIGGKYGISTPTTVEEQLDLIYSITRTRHKFCGKRNMLSDFYGINSTYENTAHAAFILAVDTMATKAMDDEAFENLWAAFNPESAAAAGFIAMVREHANANEKAPLTAALKEPLTAFFLTNHGTVSLANEVFNIFAPNITLQKIYNEIMVGGGTYRGWTVHGTDAFAYPISLHPNDIAASPGLESNLRAQLMEQFRVGDDREILACSSVPFLTSDGSQYQLEYVYDELITAYTLNLRDIEPKRIILSRNFNPKLARFVCSKSSQSHSLNVYKKLRGFLGKVAVNQAMPCEELSWLLICGNSEAITQYAHCLYKGTNGTPKNVAVALTKYREAADLGNKSARRSLSNILFEHAMGYFYSEIDYNSTRFSDSWFYYYDFRKEKNIEKSIELYEEAHDLGLIISIDMNFNRIDSILNFVRAAKKRGSKIAAKKLPKLLNDIAGYLFNAESVSPEHIIKSIELFKEAVILRAERSEYNLAAVTNWHAVWVFQGEKGFVKNIHKAIGICREAILLGSDHAARNLPKFLWEHAQDLFKRGHIREAVSSCSESAVLGNEQAVLNLPIFLYDYAKNLFYGGHGLIVDMPAAVYNCREAAVLGSEKAVRALPSFLFDYSQNLFYGANYILKNIPYAIFNCREAAVLGNEKAVRALPAFLKGYALSLSKGENGISKDISKAVEICREAIASGSQKAKILLPTLLNNYAVLLFQGESGTSRDIIKAIEVCRDASALGSESATRSLPIFLKDYALWLCKGENGISKDIPKAVDVCRESVTLGNQEAKGFFPTLLNNYAAWLFRGENGIEQNLAMAVKVCREAASLGHEKTRQKLPVYLNTYASALFEGRDNLQQDIPHAIEVCREAAELGNEEAIANLPTMLAAIH